MLMAGALFIKFQRGGQTPHLAPISGRPWIIYSDNIMYLPVLRRFDTSSSLFEPLGVNAYFFRLLLHYSFVRRFQTFALHSARHRRVITTIDAVVVSYICIVVARDIIRLFILFPFNRTGSDSLITYRSVWNVRRYCIITLKTIESSSNHADGKECRTKRVSVRSGRQ